MARERNRKRPFPHTLPYLGRGETIELWTQMSSDFYEILLRDGVIWASEEHVFDYYLPAYRWMVEQMKFRLDCDMPGFPIWGYTRFADCHLHSGAVSQMDEIVIHWRAPRHQTLLSDFDAWHAALNGHFLDLTREEDEAFDAWVRERGVTSAWTQDPDLAADIRAEIEASWERMFDFEQIERMDGYWYGEIAMLQATVPEMRLEQIISAERAGDIYARTQRRKRADRKYPKPQRAAARRRSNEPKVDRWSRQATGQTETVEES